MPVGRLPVSRAAVALDAAYDDDFEDFYRPDSPARPQATKRGSRTDNSPASSRADFADSGIRTRARSSRAREAMLRDSYEEQEEGYAEGDPEDEAVFLRARRRVPVRRHALLATRWGRILLAIGALAILGLLIATFLLVRGFFLHDARFRVAGASSIDVLGNREISRTELLSVFAPDLAAGSSRNIFSVPLAQRRIALQQLPWVQSATVMRLLPNQLRVSIVERVPVAFVRLGTRIELVDAHGVILTMSPALLGARHYSFPVVAGVSPDDPAETRAERMQVYQSFVSALDSTAVSPAAPRVSQQLSEVDVSDPEDVRALMPAAGSDILIHFGDEDFANRYRTYQQHLPQWRSQYPHLAAVDLRYDRQTVLEMQKGAAGSSGNESKVDTTPTLATAMPVARPAARKRPEQRAAVRKPVHPAKTSAHSTKPSARTGKGYRPAHAAHRNSIG